MPRPGAPTCRSAGSSRSRRADDVRAAAALCPLDRLLVETDSPYLAPVPHRGRAQPPALVAVVGEAVAEVKGIGVDELAAATWAAAERLLPAVGPGRRSSPAAARPWNATHVDLRCGRRCQLSSHPFDLVSTLTEVAVSLRPFLAMTPRHAVPGHSSESDAGGTLPRADALGGSVRPTHALVAVARRSVSAAASRCSSSTARRVGRGSTAAAGHGVDADAGADACGSRPLVRAPPASADASAASTSTTAAQHRPRSATDDAALTRRVRTSLGRRRRRRPRPPPRHGRGTDDHAAPPTTADPTARPPPSWPASASASPHGNYAAVSRRCGTYRGAYQFTQSSWNLAASHAGRHDLVGVLPNQASPADQDAMALVALPVDGLGSLGRGLHLSPPRREASAKLCR